MPARSESQRSEPFWDIRPFNDEEAPQVLKRLISDDELLAALTRLRFPQLASLIGPCLRLLIRLRLQRQFRQVRSVADFQDLVAPYVARMLDDTCTKFEVCGLDKLNEDQAYLFISNHRDITLDPALLNFALHRAGRETVRIAIGDNLLSKPYASDLMRLNKSFIVKRSVKGPKQTLAALKQLSAYIEHSICVDNVPVWIAEREGRAKDGWDRADPAVIKMLTIRMEKDCKLADYIHRLHIVPVSISYEYDPCDAAKARERYEIATNGKYEKTEHEDLLSIAQGISGFKGRIRIVFGERLSGEFDSVDAVAQEIDRQVIGNYRIASSSLYAWQAFHGALPEGYSISDCDENKQRVFLARIDAMPRPHRAYALEMYMNPIKNRKDLGLGPAPCNRDTTLP